MGTDDASLNSGKDPVLSGEGSADATAGSIGDTGATTSTAGGDGGDGGSDAGSVGESLAEASNLSPYEKMKQFEAGSRRENVKACSDDKLKFYRDIC